jgi:hypothetical protein
MKSTYKRHGTLNLFAALTIATGAFDGGPSCLPHPTYKT